MKLCKDCQHVFFNGGSPRCLSAPETDFVTGLTEYLHCRTERNFGKCGKEGKNFAPKLCENCGERPPMEHTPYCEVCRDEMEDRFAENEKAIAQHK